MNKTTYNTYARVGATFPQPTHPNIAPTPVPTVRKPWATRSSVPHGTHLLVLLLFLVLACTGAMAQVTEDKYSTYTGASSDGSTKITHKSPKWTQYHKEKGYNDTYNEADMITLENEATVQAANAYVDTIYMHKGTSTTLTLPYRVNNNNASIYNYLRWFDYRTDGSYNCNLTHISEDDEEETILDLLTPATMNNRERPIYRFANGYVVIDPGSGYVQDMMDFYYPTDEEIKSANESGFNNGDNDYYIVACDASIYTDFKKDNDGTAADFGSTNDWCEPTLAGRAIYYIIGVEDDENHRPNSFTNYWKLLEEEFQGGIDENGNEVEGKEFIDEYEITYPSRRLSNNTAEMVALTKDACAYAIPSTDPDDDPGYLDVTLIDNSLGFKLTFSQEYTGSTDGSRDVIPTGYEKNGKISGNDRIIFFYKGTLGGLSSTTAQTTVPTDTQWYVDDGSTITILVTKTITNATTGVETTYNLARYKITFKDDANLLTQTQVAGLDNLTGNEGYWWNNMTHRSPKNIESKYTQVASLTFDYSESVDAKTVLPNGQEHFYPFPMDWTSNGYAFFDGVAYNSGDANTTFDSWNGGELRVGTRFSMYSITNEYIGYWDSPNKTGYAAPPTENTVKDNSGYWLYIDASERPGAVAEITIDGDLCPGSKLYGTAWIKGAGGASSVDAGALFSLGGVTVNNDGTETHQPILRQATGQVRATTRITSDDVNEQGLTSDITGKGAGTNEWFQVYFSFVTSGVTYNYYTLRVDNYCAGTDGGDYYFDELKVYVETPTVEMVQLNPICVTSEDDRSAMRLDLDYEVMMSRLGLDPEDYDDDTDEETAKTTSVDFVIINEAQYRNDLAAYDSDTDGDYSTYQEKAFQAALVTFYDIYGGSHVFPTLDFYCNYELNEDYYDAKSPIIDFTGDEGYFYRRDNETIQELSVECLTNMIAYTEYVILLEPHTNAEKTDEERLEEFIALLEDQCAIKAEFYLSSTTILKLNGETVDPTADYCAGQEFVISPEVTYTNDSGETIYMDGVYFDWFFGSVEEYTSPVVDESGEEKFGGVTLQEALIMFRTYYPDAEELSETETPPMEGDASQFFTQDHYDIIEYYLGKERSGGMNNMLVLHRSHLDMRVLDTGLELVIQPIEITFEEENIEICFGYVPVTLYASGDAPTLKMGFSNINYPDDDYEPCLRLGLAQFEKCSEDTPFTINLCKATYVTEEGVDIDHLGVADGMDMLFLVDTDDPAYRETILGKENETEEIVVGKVARLYATTENGNDPRQDTPNIGSYMQIYFYGEDDLENDPSITPFTVREGYYYVVSVYFQEKGSFNDGEQTVGSACWGTFPLEMKIVPEYLVWTGDSTCNWNNDDHWQRVSATSINRTTDKDSPYFTDGSNTNTNGFVPMLFTKVIIPRDSEAELYMAGFEADDTDGTLSWVGDEEMEGETPTTDHEDVDEAPAPLNIMYDLMLYDTEDEQGNLVSMKTEHYRVNLCDQIHFEPGAQLLHSEQLIYNKAWTDVELAQGPWTLVSTPLNGVVSGDWYTKRATGTETAEYFTDIEFNSTDNDRLNPMVYQRNWSNSGNVIVYTDTDKDNKVVPAYATTGWSSVYNDVSVSHQAGEGFSIKASRTVDSEGKVSDESNLMFRFPKADGSYTYQNGDGTETTITRTNAGRLLISGLVSRTDPDKDDDNVYTGTVSVSLTQTDNGYYIIGNPYTAPMSMSAFMAENEGIQGYWLESTYGPVVGTGETNSWGTADCLIEPYSAFFVTTDENDITPLLRGGEEVTFTKDMQTFELDEEPAGPGPHVRKQTSFAIRAKGEGGTTSASIAYADKATDDYSAGEDAVLMEDASWKREGMPLVYSVAGDKAVSVNTLKQLTLIPIGAFADEGSLYTLSFVGVDMLDNPVLIDTYEYTETPLTEGYTLEVEGATHGRYFIRTMSTVATDIEETASPVLEVSAYSPVSRTVVVSSDAGLENVEIYSVGGMLLKRASVGGGVSSTINGVTSGIAIVKVKTTEGTSVKKIRVR